jgi:DNA-binding MarR family transcriptional regulator
MNSMTIQHSHTRPLELQGETASSIEWAAGIFQDGLARVAREVGLSAPQYRVLRILRDAGEPLSCTQIAERMVCRDPDITRLVDKLERSGLVARERSSQDRRVVLSRITPQGAELVAPLDARVGTLHNQIFSGLGEQELLDLGRRLRNLRRSR